MCRYETFRDCFLKDDCILLSESGMYAIDGKITKCFFCKVCICWRKTTEILYTHAVFSPNCPLLNGHITTNKPLSSFVFKSILQAHHNYEKSLQPNYMIPLVEKYKLFSERQNTFKNWNNSSLLVECGFFHVHSTYTQCYYCGLLIYDWVENCDPWEIHAALSPKCGFIILHKGRDYIHRILEKFKIIKQIICNLEVYSVKKLVFFHCAQNKKEAVSPPSPSPPSIPMEILCKLCLDRPMKSIFFPCNHIISCIECSTQVDNCPQCRQQINGINRIYF